MSIKRPDEYEHSNPELAIVDGDNVRGGIKTVADQSAMLSLPIDKLKNGSVVKYQSNGVWTMWELQDIGNTTDIVNWLQLENLSKVGLEEKLDLKADEDAFINPTGQGISVSDWRTELLIDNIDNTSDLEKPISTAAQSALDLKANKNGNAVEIFKAADGVDEDDVITKRQLDQITLLVDDSLYIDENNRISSNLNNFKETFIYDGTTNILTTAFDVIIFGNSLYNNAPLTSEYYIFTSPRTIEFDFPMSKFVVTPTY